MSEINRIEAKIPGIKYRPLLCEELETISINDFDDALSKKSTFILEIDKKNKLALSRWVSAKRTRSYPYARVYDSLGFVGKKVTVIPVFKDEGCDGDRDYLQWDTVSLMSLLGVHVIISYYTSAEKSDFSKNKITSQKFDTNQIRVEIDKLKSYQSDALHWNLEQINNIGKIAKKALTSYENISKNLKVKMHSSIGAEKRIVELLKEKEGFMQFSRSLAKKAQYRESKTTQLKEKVDGSKAIITIKNYLGGDYYFTCDEVDIKGKEVYLIEAKHSRDGALPSLLDIKDGLLKMILFSNIDKLQIDGKDFTPHAVLKLTTGNGLNFDNLDGALKKTIDNLKKEAEINNFQIRVG